MKKILKILGGLVVVAIIAGFGFLTFNPTLRSDPNVGLSPDTHVFGDLDVRDQGVTRSCPTSLYNSQDSA